MAVWPWNNRARSLPPNVFSWILRGQIAAMAMPVHQDLEKLRAQGVGLLVSAVPEPFDPQAVRQAGLRQLHIPVEYCRAPSEEQTRHFVAATRAELEAGGSVVVHCVGGIGRTGTLIASYLVSEGMEPNEAIALVRRRRRGSVESIEQENAVAAWAARKTHYARALPLEPVGAERPEQEGLTRANDPETSETQRPDVTLHEERDTTMANAAVTGYLKWGTNGSEVDVRALSPPPGDAPRVEELKAALRGFSTDDGVTVTLTEVLGSDGEAWVTVSCAPGRQAGLLMTAGEIVHQLVRADVYDEVLLCNP